MNFEKIQTKFREFFAKFSQIPQKIHTLFVILKIHTQIPSLRALRTQGVAIHIFIYRLPHSHFAPARNDTAT